MPGKAHTLTNTGLPASSSPGAGSGIQSAQGHCGWEKVLKGGRRQDAICQVRGGTEIMLNVLDLVQEDEVGAKGLICIVLPQ